MVDQNFEGEVYYLEFEDEHGNKQYFTDFKWLTKLWTRS